MPHFSTYIVAAALTLTLAGCAAAPVTPLADIVAVSTELSTVSPDSGSLTGGETVTLTGTGLENVDRVTFGDQQSTQVTVVSATTVTAVVPHAADYEDESVAVVAYAGEEALSSSTALQYSYDVLTGVDRQLQYAMEHWDDYNTVDYGDFNDWGGDCMNFVSQTLVARGWQTTDDWYNDAQDTWADAFVDAPTFNDWIAEHPEYGATRLTLAEIDQVKIGDIVMLDWNDNDTPDHTQIVSGIEVIDGVTHVLMAGHNLDSDFRDLLTAITVDHPDGTAWFWSLPTS